LKIYSLEVSKIKSTPVKNIMVTPPISVEKDLPLKDIVQILEGNNISGVPVVDNQRVIGVISERDILRYTRLVIGYPAKHFSQLPGGENVVAVTEERGINVMELAASITAEVMMTKEPVVAKEKTPILEVVELICDNDINRVPIVDEEEMLKGIISRADILKLIKEKGEQMIL